MRPLFKRTICFGFAVTIAALAAVQVAPDASAQSGQGWTVLLDGANMGDWDRVGDTNWRMEDGAVVADKNTGTAAAHLVSKNSYKDFALHVEFWASDDANSGIFLRCTGPQNDH